LPACATSAGDGLSSLAKIVRENAIRMLHLDLT